MHDFAPNDTPMGQLSGVSLPWVITERALIRIMIGPKT